MGCWMLGGPETQFCKKNQVNTLSILLRVCFVCWLYLKGEIGLNEFNVKEISVDVV